MKTTVAYGRGHIEFDVPDTAEILHPSHAAPIADPATGVAQALASPIGGPPLAEIARQRPGGTVCIVVSDITRPVPYKTLLPPLLDCLERNGIRRKNILLLVATGMHRPSTPEERDEMFGPDIASAYRVIDHAPEDPNELRELPARTSAGTRVRVNRHYLAADIKIATGLVEPHFMAGYSGGRKSICPGIVDLATIQRFHGPGFLENRAAENGVTDGNPCHREALDAARIAGVDFILNVTLDLDRRITGVFAGDLIDAHVAAMRHAESSCTATITAPADIVVTSAGGYPLDKTFYQTVKGMVGALPAVRPGGQILIASECSEGLGSSEYRGIMEQYVARYSDFLDDIQRSAIVRKDQWEFEMQCRVLRKVGMDNLVLCTLGLSREDATVAYATDARNLGNAETPAELLQAAVDACIRRAPKPPRVTVIPEGPYVMVCPESAGSRDRIAAIGR